jgi:thiamine biosynthesis lipoprotein
VCGRFARCGAGLVAVLAAGCGAPPTPAQPSGPSSSPPPPPLADAREPTGAAAPAADPGRAAELSVGTEPPPPIRNDGTVYGESTLMGTRVSINVYVGDDRGEATARRAGAAIQAGFDEIARIEAMMSEWQPDSELSRLSARAGETVAVSPELAEVLARSVEISRDTGGAFDVTFHGVGQLWSFRPGAVPPTREAIAAKLPLVDWTKLEVDRAATPPTVRLTQPGMMIGLGAIAKGYGVDRASAVVRARGFANHIVEAGGDTYVAGRKGTAPWVVGVQDPAATGSIGAIPLTDQSVVTSGNYQRFFTHEGVRYAHILDPKTGWPVPAERSPRSVTVVAPDATTADAYCTAVAVMGAEAGLAFIERSPTLEAVIIDATGAVLVSSGLRERYVPLRGPGSERAAKRLEALGVEARGRAGVASPP